MPINIPKARYVIFTSNEAASKERIFRAVERNKFSQTITVVMCTALVIRIYIVGLFRR